MIIAWLRRWLALPVLEDEEKNRVARLAHNIAVTMLVAAVLAAIVFLFVVPGSTLIVLALVTLLMIAATCAIGLVRRGQLGVASWILLAAFYLMVTLAMLSELGVRNLTITGYFVAVILAALLIGGRASAIVAAVSVVTALAIYLAEVSGLLVVNVEPGAPSLSQMLAPLLMFGSTLLFMRFALRTNAHAVGQFQQAASALRQANVEMESSRDALADRAATLERRTGYLQASSEVARAVVSVLDVEQLLERVVELIHDRFGLYYVGIFLLDDKEEFVTLRAGTGAAGRAMLARGHRLRVGEGMIGWSVSHGEPRVAQEARADQVRVTTPELPETRAEAALPLKSRGNVLGAITVQDTRPGVFDQEAVAVLQVLADQVAVALDNARLLRESQLALEAERRAYGEISARGWAAMVRHGRELGYVYRQGGDMAPAQGAWSADMVRAREQGEIVVGGEPRHPEGTRGPRHPEGTRGPRHPEGTRGPRHSEDPRGLPADSDGSDATVAVPIKIRDRVMGVVRLQKTDQGAPGAAWTEEEMALLQALTSQLEVALESARLYQDTQRRAIRERMIGEVTTRMRETLDVETVLRTAVDEMYLALGLEDMVIRLMPGKGATTSETSRESELGLNS